MNNFLSKITVWFKPQPIKRTSLPKTKPLKEIKPKKPYSFNSYRQLIGQLASRTIAIERRRAQQNKEKNEKEATSE